MKVKKLSLNILYEGAVILKHRETHFREKQRREKMENIFNKQIRGESYFLCSSFKWKNIVFQQYNKIKQQELSIEQLISLLGVPLAFRKKTTLRELI